MYEDVHHKVDNSQISNLAYNEMAISFIELIHSSSIDEVIKTLKEEHNGRLLRKLLGFLLPYDRGTANSIYEQKISEMDPDFIFIEPYGFSDFIKEETYQRMTDFMTKMKDKIKSL